jgi:hypothetical protein
MWGLDDFRLSKLAMFDSGMKSFSIERGVF